MTEIQTELKQVDNVWVVRVEQRNGRVQEYRCATEAQAKQLAVVLAPPSPALLS